MALAFLCSISGFIFQFTLASFLSIESGYIAESHSLTLAFFMAAMGLGAARTSLFAESDVRRSFVLTEFFVIALIPISYVCLQWFSILVAAHYLERYHLLMLGQIFVIAAGFLSGRELPFLLRLQTGEKKDAALISSHYFGALAAALFTASPLFVANGRTFYLLSISCVCFVVLILAGASFRVKFVGGGLIFLTAALMTWSEPAFAKLHYFYRTSNLYAANIFDAFRVSQDNFEIWSSPSVYQSIDVVAENAFLPEESGDGQPRREWQYWLYLDRAQQIRSVNQDIYHELMGLVPINVTRSKPKRILILGGGDGILAATLLKRGHVEQIDLVEIDAKVIDLSRNTMFITRLNEGALDNSKVKIYVDDAFSYLYKYRRLKKYDAVYLDFPFPRSDDHLRLYSVEMYRMVFDILEADGFMAFDFPFLRRSEFDDAILSTLRAAGANTIFAYGENVTFLMALTKKIDLARKEAKNGLGELPQTYYVDLADRISPPESTKDKPFNSIFRPLWKLRKR